MIVADRRTLEVFDPPFDLCPLCGAYAIVKLPPGVLALHGRLTEWDAECWCGWFKCLGCFRFFTKRVGELFCYDCVQERRSR